MLPRRAWETDFHYAARTGDLPTVLSALDEGLHPDKRDRRGSTALLLAAQHGQVGVARLLLEHGAQVDSLMKWRFTALALAVMGRHTEVALLLIESGADVNHVVAMEERSIFSLAAICGLYPVVEAMLRRGADPGHRDAVGRTVLSYAREIEDADMVRLLVDAGAVE